MYKYTKKPYIYAINIDFYKAVTKSLNVTKQHLVTVIREEEIGGLEQGHVMAFYTFLFRRDK